METEATGAAGLGAAKGSAEEATAMLETAAVLAARLGIGSMVIAEVALVDGATSAAGVPPACAGVLAGPLALVALASSDLAAISVPSEVSGRAGLAEVEKGTLGTTETGAAGRGSPGPGAEASEIEAERVRLREAGGAGEAGAAWPSTMETAGMAAVAAFFRGARFFLSEPAAAAASSVSVAPAFFLLLAGGGFFLCRSSSFALSAARACACNRSCPALRVRGTGATGVGTAPSCS